MANHKQAEKRNRQRVKRRARNLLHLSSMRTYIKRVRNALERKDLAQAEAALPEAIKAIGKAVAKGIIHNKTAARYNSRIVLAVNRQRAHAA